MIDRLLTVLAFIFIKRRSKMNLARFARRRYTEGFTPIEAVPRFSGILGGPNIYIKRDDLL
jgi:hypothetical protein